MEDNFFLQHFTFLCHRLLVFKMNLKRRRKMLKMIWSDVKTERKTCKLKLKIQVMKCKVLRVKTRLKRK